MITQIRKVYQCEHCKRNMISAGAMSRHEKFCRRNPNNQHKCFDTCRMLKRSIELIPDKDPTSRDSYRTIFTCLSTGKQMYSYLFEKNMNFKPEFVEGLMRMPLQCNMHDYMNESELEKRFNVSYESI